MEEAGSLNVWAYKGEIYNSKVSNRAGGPGEGDSEAGDHGVGECMVGWSYGSGGHGGRVEIRGEDCGDE